MVSDLLKQLLINVIDSFIGIFSGVTLLVYLCLPKCDIRFFGLQYATIGGSLKVFWKPGYFFITTLQAECITLGIPCNC